MVFYDYIKNELCVNKDKPKLNCNGECYLMKELAKAAENDNDKKTPVFEVSMVFYQEIAESFSLPAFLPLYEVKIPSYCDLSYFRLSEESVFHPPIV